MKAKQLGVEFVHYFQEDKYGTQLVVRRTLV